MTKTLAVIFGVIALLSLIANGLQFARYSTSRPLVRYYGNKAITRKEFKDNIEAQYGKPVLSKMLFAKLVLDAADKAHLMPTAQEVDDRMAEINRRTPQLTAAARQDPEKMVSLKGDLRVDMAAENLRMQDIGATDDEVTAFYEKNKKMFVVPPQIETTIVVTDNAVDASTAESMLQQGLAPDVIARQPRLHVVGQRGFQINLQALSPAEGQNLQKSIEAMQSKDIKTFKVDNVELTIKVNNRVPGGTPDFSQIKNQVIRTVKLAKAPSIQVELAKLYQAAKPRFDNDRYKSYFSDVEHFDIAAMNKDSKLPGAP